MTLPKRGFGIIVALFLIMFLVSGPGLMSLTVLFPALIKDFGWSHAQAARIAAVGVLTVGLMSPAVGWLIDRIGARLSIGIGLLIVGVTEIAFSMAYTLHAIVLLHVALGIGAAMAGIIPLMVVMINWFKERSGFASGVAITGMSLGMTIAPPLLTWLIATVGWRWTVRCMTIPLFLVALPVALIFIRTRPPEEESVSHKVEMDSQPGLDTLPAVSTVSFWLSMAAMFLFSIGFGMIFVHLITYLIGIGYSPEHAALILSAQTLTTGLGVLATGALADRFGPRPVLALSFVGFALGIIALLGTASAQFSGLMIAAFALTWGLCVGAPNQLLPILLSQTLGRRRLGTLTGVIFLGSSIATAIGPIFSGWLYDRHGNYTLAFELACLLSAAATLAIVLVRPAKGHDRIPAAGGEMVTQRAAQAG